jgi:nitrite reductase/ring-hydroxylating ferredoxin subunit
MSIIQHKEAPDSCPKCGNKSIDFILYGLPDLSVIDAELKSGKVTLGGCVLFEDSPQWRCNSCSHQWGETSVKEVLKEIQRNNELKEEIEKKEALARGAMDAYVNEHGWVKCPYCNYSFKIENGLSREGTHKSCGTYLNIRSK